MPELPEVEAARRAIEEHCMGKKIVKAMIAEDSKVIEGVSASDFETSILGKTIVSAHRKGKNMWLRLDSPPFPSFQFGTSDFHLLLLFLIIMCLLAKSSFVSSSGMAGAVYIKGVAVTKYKRSAVNDADEWPSKYSKFFVQLDDGLEMSFTDKRRFAKVRLLEDPMVVSPISGLGPDALLEPMAEEEFIGSLNKKKIAIKALLLDQSYISGIGNWIADEVLYQAKIHPMQPASSLSKESCTTLLKCIKEVIEKTVEVGADSSQYPNNWIFHSREKKPGKAFVDGKKIDFITAGGRTSAYVPELQKLNGMQPSKAVDKSKKKASKQKENNDDEQDEDEEDDNDTNEPESGKDPKSVKAKGRKKPVGGGRTSSKRRKSEETDEEDGHDEEDEEDDDVTESKGNSSTSIKSKQVKIAKGKGTNKKSLQSKKKAK